MPASFVVDVERRIIFLRLSGVVTVFDNLPDAMEFLGLDRDTPWPAQA